jgi:hypothetical protein
MWILTILVLSQPPQFMEYETPFATVVECVRELNIQADKFAAKYPAVKFKIQCTPRG